MLRVPGGVSPCCPLLHVYRGPSNHWKVLYRGISLIRNSPPLGPYSRPMLRTLWWSLGRVRFLISEIPLHLAALFDQDQKDGAACGELPLFLCITIQPRGE